MNLVAGVMDFPMLVGFDVSLARSEDAVCQMEAQDQEDLAVVLRRNLAISWGLHVVDALLLTLHHRVQLLFPHGSWSTHRCTMLCMIHDPWEMRMLYDP